MAKTKVDFTVAQKEYIEKNFDKKSVKDIVAATGLAAYKVERFIVQLKKSSRVSSDPEQAGFDVYYGADGNGSATVSMTQKGSELGDESRKNEDKPRNEKFFERRIKNGIHVIDPKRPIH